MLSAQRKVVGGSVRRWVCTSSAVLEKAKLWGGRFSGDTDPHMEAFNASIDYDRRLCYVDLEGSRQYAKAMGATGLLSDDQVAAIVDGLGEVEKEWASGSFEIQDGDEDIHTANERRLTEIIGPVGGMLHTGRSRNDQVATDVRLWLREELDSLHTATCDLIEVATTRARDEVDIMMPGYTHLQVAQPIRWGHWLMSHATTWRRDAERLKEIRARTDVMPLGSGALAGHRFGLNRVELAKALKFTGGPSLNSLDAVSDRDFITETLFWASLASVHLSRLAEDLIIYSSKEFGFIQTSDAYSTGSSLMPQKKNPDALELIRGKSGRMLGNMTGLLTTMKGLPSTYNKDLQEDKEPLFDTVATMSGVLHIATGVLATLDVNQAAMAGALQAEMLATDLADYLVERGVPFRESHSIVGAAVQMAEDKTVPLSDLTLADLKPLHDAFDDDVTGCWSFEASVEARSSMGGTSKSSVLEQVDTMEAWLREVRR